MCWKLAYPKFGGSQGLKKAHIVKRQCNRAKVKLASGKKMSARERRSANALLESTSKKLCPFEQQYSRCSDVNCTFLHNMSFGKTGRGTSNYRNGDVLTGVVQRWSWIGKEERGFGFVQGSDGREYYVSSARLLFDGRDLQKGMSVRFEVKLVEDSGKRNGAVNVVVR